MGGVFDVTIVRCRAAWGVDCRQALSMANPRHDDGTNAVLATCGHAQDA
jgi:hypothetical protein